MGALSPTLQAGAVRLHPVLSIRTIPPGTKADQDRKIILGFLDIMLIS